MRGDPLAERWRVNRGIEASPNELTVVEIARPAAAQGTARKRSPSKACSKTGIGFFGIGREPKQIDCLMHFKKPALIGEGKKVQDFNSVPPQCFRGNKPRNESGGGWQSKGRGHC